MRRFIILFSAMSLVLLPSFTYMYVKGGIDGVARYRNSRHFALTLYSMFVMGVQEGYADCKAGK